MSQEITEQRINFEDSFMKTALVTTKNEKKDSIYEPLAKRFKFDKTMSEWHRSIGVFKSDTRSVTGHL